MQSLEQIKPAMNVRSVPVVKRHLGIASGNHRYSAARPKQASADRHVYKTEDGMIIVHEKQGVFYIRHNIIFAKAGDVFYMPRKIPADFEIEAERVISDEELYQIESNELANC